MINQYQDKQYQRGTMSKFNNNKDKPYQRKTMTNTIYITNIFNLHVNSGRKRPKSLKNKTIMKMFTSSKNSAS